MYRNADLRKYQFYITTDWPGRHLLHKYHSWAILTLICRGTLRQPKLVRIPVRARVSWT